MVCAAKGVEGMVTLEVRDRSSIVSRSTIKRLASNAAAGIACCSTCGLWDYVASSGLFRAGTGTIGIGACWGAL